MISLHYYQFNIGDYSSHTNHLDPLEDLAYRRMLDWCYLNESHLPSDLDEIARLIRMRTHTECIAVVLRDFFTASDEGYTQCRIDAEIAAYQEKSAKAKKSAEARWNKTPIKDGDSIDANALQTQSEGNAKHKPLNTKHKTLTKDKTLDHSANDQLFENFWSSGIRKVSKKKTKALFNNLLKKEVSHDAFVRLLTTDVHKRIRANQLGFAEMHPTTYLNGERWNDEVITDDNKNQSGTTTTGHQQQKLSVVGRVQRANEERERARQKSSGKGDGYPLDSINRDIRPPITQPVRGDNADQLGTVIDGSYTRSDS